jgi:hypothetical protein
MSPVPPGNPHLLVAAPPGGHNRQADSPWPSDDNWRKGDYRAVRAASLGLVFWLVLAAVVVRWYDRQGFHRLDPELLGYVAGSVQQYKSRNARAGHRTPGTQAGRQAEPNADVRHQDSGNAARQTEPGTQV